MHLASSFLILEPQHNMHALGRLGYLRTSDGVDGRFEWGEKGFGVRKRDGELGEQQQLHLPPRNLTGDSHSHHHLSLLGVA